jgi:hypothetical protein
MKMSSERLGFWITIAVTIVYIMYVFYYEDRYKYAGRNKASICVEITKMKWYFGKWASVSIFYSFQYKGQTWNIEDGKYLSRIRKNAMPDEAYEKKHFLALFDSLNPSASTIIISIGDREEYGVTDAEWNSCVDSIFRLPTNKKY